MDDQDKSANEGEESTSHEAITKKNDAVVLIQDNAGPSGTDNLPGTVYSSKPLYKTGLSKSEHDIRHIITNKDVANALQLTSLSFGPTSPIIKSLNVKELKIPILQKGTTEKDSAGFVDLKRFMASCFRNRETANSASVEGPVETKNRILEEIPTSVCVVDSQTETSVVIVKQNEVIVTKTNAIEPKLSKIADNASKKKNSGSLSERSDLGITQRDSLSSIGSNVCRICMTRGRERLISPCNCKGSLANVHLSCLERWLNQVGRNHCELCGYSYPAIRTPRYTVLQALRLWFGNPRNRSHLQSDCLIFWLLSTVTAGLLAVCIVGTQYFVIEGNKFGKLAAGARKTEGISHRITETAMDFFMAIVLCGYSVTVYLLWKDHYVMWNRWRQANVNVRLLLSPDATPVPFVPRRSRFSVV